MAQYRYSVTCEECGEIEADLQRRIDLERARALFYCNSCMTPVEEPHERDAYCNGGPTTSVRLEESEPGVIGGDD
jgi:protein-arginine kinase activator protein McsA